jgi:hypothetical protein
VFERIKDIGRDATRLKMFWDVQDRMLEEAILPVALLATMADILSDGMAEKRIKMAYIMERCVYFDLASTHDPRVISAKKSPLLKQTEKIMANVWESLQHVPVVQEEIEKQKQAGRLPKWKRQMRNSAQQAYAKMTDPKRPDSMSAKIEKYSNELRQLLFPGDISKNPVKPSETLFDAKKHPSMASNTKIDPEKAPVMASNAKSSKSSSKQGVRSSRVKRKGD